MGGISLLFKEHLGQEWSEIPISPNPAPGESLTISVTIDRFGVFALIADSESLAQPTTKAIEPIALPTPTPLPTPVTEILAPQTLQPGAAFGPLVAGLAPILAMLWYIRMMGLRQ